MIVTTLSNTGDFAIYDNFQPAVILLDEASRALEPDMWNLIGNYNAHSLVMIGDDAQLQLNIMSAQNGDGGSYPNPFSDQLNMSYFAKSKLLGREFVMLKVQYRMIPEIANMISKTFYGEQLANSLETRIFSRPKARAIQEYLKRIYYVQKPIMTLTVTGHAETDINPLATRTVWGQVAFELLMLRNGIRCLLASLVFPFKPQGK